MVARIVIAGTASHVGKTTVTLALTSALRAIGLRVATFKCGPDYLDPSYHARASGEPCHNLDGFMMGREAVLATFARGSNAADVAVLEGVMGLFDGSSPTGDEGSTAEIAKWLEASVLLVCEASGMARSIAALAQGFTRFDPQLDVAGLICNRIGSRGHLELLRKATGGVPRILGGFLEEPGLSFPERHLGLHAADRDVLSDEVLAAWGARASEWLDLPGILEIARGAPPLPSVPAPAASTSAARCRIGLAFDHAFHFYYEDNLRRLESLGAELVRFSPVADARLPDVDGLYFGGGYPELFAEGLAANASMRADVAAFAGSGRPIYAECGGLMYLTGAIRTLDGRAHAMAGVLPGEAVMSDRMQALGYVEVETQERSPLGPPGLRFRGHQFRYSELSGVPDETARVYSVRRRRGGDTSREGYRVGNVLASYVHAHWASNPAVARNLVESFAGRRAR